MKSKIEAMFSVAGTGLILVAIAGAVIWGVWALLHLSWKMSEEVVGGIVYDATFDDWPGHKSRQGLYECLAGRSNSWHGLTFVYLEEEQ